VTAATLTDDTYAVAVTATDGLGNTASTVQNLTVDTVTSVAITSADATNDPTPAISGTGEPGASITLAVLDQVLTTTVAGDGSWSLTVAGDLADGTHTLAVTSTDVLGNVAVASHDLVVDTVTTVSITTPPLTNDPSPVIGGLGVPGDSITLVVGGQTLMTTVAPDGTWSVAVADALVDGALTVTVTATDAVGNSAVASQDLTIDTTLAAVVTSPTVGNDPAPTISGTGEPGAVITIEIAGQTLTTTVGTDGTWSVDVGSDLANGSHTGLVTVVDLAGNTASFSHLFVIDTVAQLTSTSPGVVSSSTPTIFGTGEPGSTVTVTVAGRTYSTTVAADGTWSVVIGSELVDGEHPVVVRTEDALGNVESTTWTLVVDTVAELGTTPPIATANGQLNGTGEPGASVTVTVAGVTTVVTVAADGTWSVPLPNGLAPGTHAVHVAIRDLAGNTAESTSTIVISARPLPTTGGSTPAIAGTALLLALVGGFLHVVAASPRRRPIDGAR
jgi:hypothetical protein